PARLDVLVLLDEATGSVPALSAAAVRAPPLVDGRVDRPELLTRVVERLALDIRDLHARGAAGGNLARAILSRRRLARRRDHHAGVPRGLPQLHELADLVGVARRPGRRGVPLAPLDEQDEVVRARRLGRRDPRVPVAGVLARPSAVFLRGARRAGGAPGRRAVLLPAPAVEALLGQSARVVAGVPRRAPPRGPSSAVAVSSPTSPGVPREVDRGEVVRLGRLLPGRPGAERVGPRLGLRFLRKKPIP
ncbi:hypothetical protein THAOC_00819, partial [Thalassiosira oceanica]